MDSLIKASENFEQVNNIEETLDESKFLEYMRKVPIWDFFCVSKQEYPKMAEEEKKIKISQYYSAMQSRHVPDGEFLIFLFLFCFLECLFQLKIIKKLQDLSFIDLFYHLLL